MANSSSEFSVRHRSTAQSFSCRTNRKTDFCETWQSLRIPIFLLSTRALAVSYMLKSGLNMVILEYRLPGRTARLPCVLFSLKTRHMASN